MDGEARTYRDGLCYGSGAECTDPEGDDVRTGRCPECGRRVGMNGGSATRLANHHPPDLRRLERERMLKRMAARIVVQDWITLERKRYADIKYAEGTEARHKLILEAQNYGLDGEWMVFIGNYLKRVELFGLDTAKGRQALGKAIVTMMHALETSVQYLGPMPEPGVSSTEGAKEWVR